jgi:plasmid maintenance system antidote protein VapI
MSMMPYNRNQLPADIRKVISWEMSEMLEKMYSEDAFSSMYTLADKMGISQSTISGVINHERVGHHVAERFLKYAKTDIETLLKKYRNRLPKEAHSNTAKPSPVVIDTQLIESLPLSEPVAALGKTGKYSHTALTQVELMYLKSGKTLGLSQLEMLADNYNVMFRMMFPPK